MTVSYEIASIKILSAPRLGEVRKDTSPEPLAGKRAGVSGFRPSGLGDWSRPGQRAWPRARGHEGSRRRLLGQEPWAPAPPGRLRRWKTWTLAGELLCSKSHRPALGHDGPRSSLRCPRAAAQALAVARLDVWSLAGRQAPGRHPE